MSQSLVKTIADFSTVLVNKVAIGATSATLESATDKDGVALPAGTYSFTIDRKNSAKEHFTAVLSGTSLTSIKTVARGTGLGTSGFLRAHRKGAEIIISDFAAIKRIGNVLDGTTDLDASTPLKYDGVVTNTPGSNEMITVVNAEALANQGAATASTTTKGIVKISTAPVDSNNPIAVGDNDTRVPTVNTSSLTAGMVAALAGTSGTPASTNKYVTDNDTSSGVDQVQTTQDATIAVGEADATTKKNLVAQSFTAGKSHYIGVQLHKLADTGSFTGTVKVALQADSAGSPSGSDLASVTLSNAYWLALPNGLVTCTFGTAYTSATVGSLYWIVVTPSTADTSNHPNLGTNSAGGYSGGSVKAKNTTDGWTAVATVDLTFKTLTSFVGKALRGDTTGRFFGQIWYGVDGGADDSYEVQIPTFPGTLQAGDQILFYAATANTGAATISINGTTAKTLKKMHDQDLDTGDIEAGQLVHAGYDGTNYQMLSPVASTPGFAQLLTVKTGTEATGVGDTVWTHGLGKTPRKVSVAYHFGAANYGGSGHGSWDGSSQAAVWSVAIASNPGAENSSSSVFVYAFQDAAQSNGQTGTITVNSTTVTITYTKVGSGLGNIRLLLTAET